MSVKIKSGLEIHQQLETHKLFCNCPSVLRNDEPEFEVSRKLHAVAGESGEIDVAAKHEAELDKKFVYQGYGTTCLVELDEEPPHLINQEALQTTLHIALLLNCEIMSIAQIMRKTVVDGSNTSGFQRTVLIARNGYVETSLGKVGINALLLEEDSARPVNDDGDLKIYKLDRLGVPLVEIATEPDIKSAEHAKETALLIGDILRSCKVKRGIGTIRQDVNISIPGHPRIEIKGFQDPKMMIKTVEVEVERQEKNLKSGKDLKSEVRGALPDGSSKFQRPMPGASRMYPETDLPLLRISRDIINDAKRTLPKLRSEINEELRKTGLSENMVKAILKENKVEEFKALLVIIDEPVFVAQVMIELPREIGAHESVEDINKVLTMDIIESVLQAVNGKKISRSDVKHVMEEIVKGKSFDEAVKIEKVGVGEIESYVAKLIKEKPGLSVGGYMGLVMKEFKGKVGGKDVGEVLGKLMK
ncbi:Glu-tRNA(Gln) amidotransferase subunit GatE [archaeon]|jgi:Glu-tRNA(Gln) amidotransferase subunit E-like FAD-binding protein|nr:Glu-tRNA(Gln) amidotransferase subunit GatE [archaeon]